MQFPFPPPPPGFEPPPGPIEQTLALFCGVVLLFGLFLLVLPDEWGSGVLRALLGGVWPFSQVGAWLRRQSR